MADELRYIQSYDRDGLRLHHWPDEWPNTEAQYALDLIRSWGLVLGKPGSEDSAGRAVLSNMPIEDVVDRAVGLASAAYARLRKEGLLLKVDDYETALGRAREERGRN